MLGSVVFLALTSVLPQSAMLSYGWRIPFLLSFLMVAVGLALRLKVDETPLFRKAKERGLLVAVPSRDTFRKYWREVLLGTVIAGSLGTIFYVGAVLLPTYYSLLGLSPSSVFLGAFAFAASEVTFVFVGGALGDAAGRKPVLLIANGLPLLAVYPVFLFHSVATFFAAMVLFGFFHGVGYSPLAALIAEIFPTNVRYTGSSSAYQFGNAFLGGPASYVSADLGSLSVLLYPLYMIVLSVITLGFILRARESKEVSMEG
ncbi:hypothetical protein GCM10007116_07700 [Sulfodiicoccus acidiphilus]|uniref:Major facilitator superfamily (MFS) profile domain-containing protein n=2 Tax=Sulfodiicoccus acidiphilus TaxID=1670455 RepID=A0A830H2M7_9CREN|nr:hypothetical protein GCM10007116_07700 [Sulfodiicoccus acidiphilus]